MTEEKIFNNYSRYYDLLYKDKNYESEVNYILSLLSKYGIKSGSILEFGSGTGKHGILLGKNGFSVHGIELSEEMVKKSIINENFTCQQGDIALINLEKQYNIVLSLFHVMSYQTSNEKLNAVFFNASKHLLPGGLFVFDFWYSPAVYSQRPITRVKRMHDEYLNVTRIAEPLNKPELNVVDVKFTIFSKDVFSNQIDVLEEIHPMRHFSLPELKLFAQINGFEYVEAQEFLSGNTTSEETWGVCIILKKK